jgi:diguanylate cyclase (GGDEF)-like protein/PAS domain S-box-containing protein
VTLFNPPAVKLFTLDAGSVGSLLFSLPCLVDVGDAAALVNQVIATGVLAERQLIGERCHLLRVQPYRSAAGESKGAVLSFHDNTDLLASSKALQLANEQTAAAERFARATIDALPEQIGVIDAAGMLVSTNAQWRQATAEQCITTRGCQEGSNLLDALQRAERGGDTLAAQLATAARAVLDGREPSCKLEYAASSQAGERHFQTTIAPFDTGTAPGHWTVIHEDITQRTQQEKRIRLQARALNSSLNAISIADFRLPNLPLVYVNEAFESITGYTADEVLGLNCRFLQGAETNQPAMQQVRQALAQQAPVRALLRNFRKDGTLFWNELTLAPITEDGQLTHYVGLQRDMTAILASEEALKASQERESQALTFAGLGSLDIDIRAGRATLSERHARLFGLPGDQRAIEIAELRRLVLAEDQPLFDDSIKLCVAGHQTLDIDYRVQWPDGTQHWLHTQGDVVLDERGTATRLLALTQDVSARKGAEDRVRFIAHHDALTGLPNRALLRDRFQLALNGARRNRSRLALVFLDLDHFKDVNDSLGHEVGDGLLVSVAERMRSCLRDTDTVCRQSGDEFIVLLPNVRDSNDAAHLAEKLVAALGKPHQVLGHDLRVTCSAGVSLFPDDGETIDLLMRHADSAMYHAKGMGRNNVEFFSRELTARHQDRVSIATALRQALANDELRLHYQPQFDVSTGALMGIEALVRWQHPERGLVYPDSFIGVAEESELIVDIGD